MITKVFIQSLFGINWFGFSGLFRSVCLSTQAGKKAEKKKGVMTYI
jgi:hypothetical protein